MISYCCIAKCQSVGLTGKHRWEVNQCMVCTSCGECTGYGSSCISSGRADRVPGQYVIHKLYFPKLKQLEPNFFVILWHCHYKYQILILMNVILNQLNLLF